MEKTRASIYFLSLLVLAVVFACNDRVIPIKGEKPIITAWIPAGGKSMLPNYPESALIEIEIGYDFEYLKEGDAVVFWDYKRGDNALTHHRLVKKQGSHWIAKGDNNERHDESWVTKDNYIARGTGKHTQILFVGNMK